MSGPTMRVWIVSVPSEAWDRLGGAADFRFLVRDRAGQFITSFDTVLAGAGIQAVKDPPRSPFANAYAERLVLGARGG
jgi:putative transposase